MMDPRRTTAKEMIRMAYMLYVRFFSADISNDREINQNRTNEKMFLVTSASKVDVGRSCSGE